MKAKIDKDGDLLIERKGTYQYQSCPFRPSGNKCGDWCPLFHELKSDIGTNHVVVIGCATGVAQEIVSDERKAGDAT